MPAATPVQPPNLLAHHTGGLPFQPSSAFGHPLFGPLPWNVQEALRTGAGEAGEGRMFKLMVSGGLAGAVSRTCTAPVDRLKFLMIMAHPDKQTRLTVRQGLAAMAAEGSWKAYFRGNGCNVVKNVPETAIKMGFNDRIKALVVNDGHPITLGERLLVGAGAGGLAQVAVYPLEVIQTRLAATHGAYAGIADAAAKIWRTEGAAAFMRGMVPTMLGILPYAGLDIAAFELMHDRLRLAYGDPAAVPPAALLAAGMLSSTGAQLVAYPLGFVRTRLQMDGRDGAPRQYRGMIDCFRQVAYKEGLAGLYKGVAMTIGKIAPAAGISWVVYEETRILLKCSDHPCRS
ncbi:hypothetical protein WJX81_007778 [Elliptochloris bilobata]|uniref:Uncharacterized protein n=1 Tax=Elliptochloris bilobata TaxID=381761 RepID=A0AAW1QNH8_9CHLO